MRNAKKFLSLIMAVLMILSIFTLTSCSENNTKDPVPTPTADNSEKKPEKVRVITLAGPTGMGMAKLIDDNTNKKTSYNYEFNIASAPDQVSPEVIKGNFDIACVPVNLASVLFNKTEGKIKVMGVNTLGVLYMLENGNTINSVSDLKNKTIYATGQGSNPEYVLRYILEKNNIDPDKDVKIEFLAEHAELATKLKTNAVAIGMLPEPQVTVATMGDSQTRIALDLTEEWNKVSDYKLIQGCIIVRNEFAEKHPTAVKGFLAEYKNSVDYVNNNIEEASQLIEKAGIVPKAAIAKKAIPNCNICLITGDEMKNSVKQMLDVLHKANPASVGGKLPTDEFYY
ncbi:MAG: ABC transporter substrate-binding protein [Ruminococcaceae bacterium]|nr:ABC transporter substrate-binding protein [Oscillospiraceae bacterium]